MAVSQNTNRGPSAGPENRQALIDAAREVFGESGLLAPLNSVARRAGVGQGSLYRHFPDRIALGVAVFDDNITALEDLSTQADSTLDDLFDAIADQAIGSAALIDLTAANRHDPRAKHLETRLTVVASAMLSRDQEHGLVAARVTVGDVMLSIAMLAFALSRTDQDDRPAVAAQAKAIFHSAFSN